MSDPTFPIRREPRRSFTGSGASSLSLLVESILYGALERGASDILIEVDLSPSVYKIRFLDNGRALRVEDISQNWIKTSKRVTISSSKKEKWTFYMGMPQNYESKGDSASFLNEMDFSDFLYAHPVRQKILHPYRDVEEVRLSVIVPYSLLHYNVSFTLKEERRKEVVYSVDAKGSSTRRERLLNHLQTVKIPCSEAHLKEITQEREAFHIVGLMTSLGVPSEKEQYLFLNGRNVRKSKVYLFINELWRKNAHQSSIPLHPCYLLLIRCPENEYTITYESKGVSVEFSRWSLLAHLLKKTLLRFISENKTGMSRGPFTATSRNPPLPRPRINGSAFSISGVRPLEATSHEDPRILSHVLKRKQETFSQFQIADLHDGVRKGLPAQKMRVMSNPPDENIFLKTNGEEEDEVISSVRSTDFPDSFGMRSQSLRNNSSLYTSTSSGRSNEKYCPPSNNKFFNDTIDNEAIDFPLSSTMNHGVNSEIPLPGVFSSSPRYFPIDDSNNSFSSLDQTEPYMSQSFLKRDGISPSPTPFNFVETDTKQSESPSPKMTRVTNNSTRNASIINVTQVSEIDSLPMKDASKENKEVYKEFLLKEMAKIKAQLKELGGHPNDDNDHHQMLSKSVQTSPVKSSGLIIQSQVTTTTVQVDAKDNRYVDDETHATFRVIDKTLIYPEASILKSSKMPDGWIRKSLANGEDLFIHVESGFTANSLDEITQKSSNPQPKKSLLNVVRERGNFQPPPNKSSPTKNPLKAIAWEHWENPIMKTTPDEICPVAFKSDGGRKSLNAIENVKFDKSVFKSLEVLHQLDNKIIITLLNDETLVLLDQHAVHERIRLEKLIQENFSEHTVTSVELPSPMVASLSPSICRLLKEYPSILQRFGLRLVDVTSEDILVFSHVPACFIYAEDSKFNSSLSLKDLICALCKDVYQNVMDLGTESKILPPTIRDVLNSQACRGAIKFGDPLSLIKCQDLISDLTHCQTPFQCAHGRPSIAPIINLNSLKISPAYRKEHFTRIDFIKLKYNRFVK